MKADEREAYRLMFPRPNVRLVQAVLVPVLLATIAGCGYVYRADIQGRVTDADDGSGVNQATVRIYEEEPGSPDSGGFMVRTQTATTGGTTGVFQTGIAWREMFGEFGTEADTTTLWAGITHPDYEGTVAELSGILSGENNVVGEIALLDLDRDEDALSAVVQGRVFEPVNGEREPVAGYEVEVTVDEVEDADGNTNSGPDQDDVVVDDPARTGATGTFVVVPEWPEDSGIVAVTLEFTYSEGLQDDITRSITVEDGDNEFVQDVTLDD